MTGFEVALAALLQPTLYSLGISTSAVVAGLVSAGPTILGIGASVGLSAVAQALFSPSVPKPSDGRITVKQSIPSIVHILGIARTSGSYAFYEVEGPNLWTIQMLCSGPVHAIEQVYVSDDEATLDMAGQVTTDDHGFGDELILKTRLGAVPSTAYSEVVAAFSGVWTNDHRGDGICTLSMYAQGVDIEKFGRKYPKGKPEPSARIAGRKQFDPRDGGHDYADSSTWEWSDNPVLHLLWYITQNEGLGLSYSQWVAPNIAEWKAAADYCDALVAKVGGTEKRYRHWLRFTSDTQPAAVITSILKACDGWFYTTTDGTLGIKCGYTPATVRIPKENIRSLQYKLGNRRERTINAFNISFLSIDDGYIEAPGEQWRDDVSIARQGLLSQDLDFNSVPSHSQARRLTKKAFLRANAEASGTAVTDLYGIMALDQRFIELDIGFGGFTEVEVLKFTFDPVSATCTIQWAVVYDDIKSDAWDPDTEEGSATPGAVPVVQPPVPMPLEVIAHFKTATQIEVDWRATGFTAYGFEIEYRDQSGPGDWVVITEVRPTQVGGVFAFVFAPVITAAVYEVRMRSRLSSKYSTYTAEYQVLDGGVYVDDSGAVMVDDDGYFMMEDA